MVYIYSLDITNLLCDRLETTFPIDIVQMMKKKKKKNNDDYGEASQLNRIRWIIKKKYIKTKLNNIDII